MIPGNTIVVVSPHSDDGVLSLGASMARWARSGRRVELLTVLALDPDSTAPSSGWDRRAGFATEGEAARARREEDASRVRALGVTPGWLPFGSVDFDRHGDDDDVWGAVRSAVEGADCVLVPGSPLTHPDHAWLTGLAHETCAAPSASASTPSSRTRARQCWRRRSRAVSLARARPAREVARDPRLRLPASAPRACGEPCVAGRSPWRCAAERVAWPDV